MRIECEESDILKEILAPVSTLHLDDSTNENYIHVYSNTVIDEVDNEPIGAGVRIASRSLT